MNLKHWAFDPDGTNTDNVVEKERHDYEHTDPYSQLITPLYGPFFEATLFDGDGKKIDDNEWVYGDEAPPLSPLIKRKLYHSVILKSSVKRDVLITYHTVGSELVRPRTEVADYLVNVLNTPINTKWSSVKHIPHIYPVNEHSQHWIDFKNSNKLAEAIETIGDAFLENVGENTSSELSDIRSKLSLLGETLNQYRLEEHINDPMAHSPDAANYRAEQKDSIAINADRVYGLTYLALCVESQLTGVSWDEVSNYLKRFNDVMLVGDLIVQEDLKWGNKSTKDGLNAVNFARFGSDSYVSIGHTKCPLTITNDAVRFAGGKLFDLKSAVEYSKQLEGVKLVSIQSDDFLIDGNGSGLSPIALSINYPLASRDKKGFAQLTSIIDGRYKGYGLTSASLERLNNSLSTYLPKSTTINGVSIGDGIIDLTAKSIALGDVENTPDVNKEISLAQEQAIAQLSSRKHTHVWSDVNWLEADNATYGIDKVVDTLEEQGAVSHQLGTSTIDLFNALLNTYSEKVEDESIRLVATKGVQVVCSQTDIMLSGGEYYNIEFGNKTIKLLPSQKVDYPVETHGLDRDLLLYFDIGKANYFISKVPLDSTEYALVGKVNPYRSVSGRLPAVLDYGNDQLLEEHKQDDKPHGLNYKTLDLDKLANLDTYRSSVMSNALVFDGNKVYESKVRGFNSVNCTGLAVQSLGGEPLAWRGAEYDGIVYQSSFVANCEESALIDSGEVPFDIVLGYIKDTTSIRLLTVTLKPNTTPKLYIENWSYTNEEGKCVLTNATRTELELDITNNRRPINAGGELGLFRWYYGTSDNEFKMEVMSGTHEVFEGYVLALDSGVKKQLVELLNHPYVGLRLSRGSKLSIGGCVRSPSPQYDVYINDYTTLFNSYVSTLTVEEEKRNLGTHTTPVTLKGYYRASDNKLVLGNIDEQLPHGYNTLDFQPLSLESSDSSTLDIRLNHKDLLDKLSMGSIVNTKLWSDGYSAQFKRKLETVIEFDNLPTYGGVELGTYPLDGAPMVLRGVLRCSNNSWGISAYDWNSLSQHLTGYVEPTPPILVEQLLSGFESILIEV